MNDKVRICIELPNTGLEEDILRKGEWENDSLFGMCLRNALMHFTKVSSRPKMGHWIYDDKCREHGHCSECGYGSVDLVDGEPHNFCRRCGIMMYEYKKSRK